MITLKKLDEIEELSKRTVTYDFEQVDWEDGNKSFECHPRGDGFMSISELNFETRADARRYAEYFNAVEPVTIASLIALVREAVKVIEFYGNDDAHKDAATFDERILWLDETDLEYVSDKVKHYRIGKRARAFLSRLRDDDKKGDGQ